MTIRAWHCARCVWLGVERPIWCACPCDAVEVFVCPVAETVAGWWPATVGATARPSRYLIDAPSGEGAGP